MACYFYLFYVAGESVFCDICNAKIKKEINQNADRKNRGQQVQRLQLPAVFASVIFGRDLCACAGTGQTDPRGGGCIGIPCLVTGQVEAWGLNIDLLFTWGPW